MDNPKPEKRFRCLNIRKHLEKPENKELKDKIYETLVDMLREEKYTLHQLKRVIFLTLVEHIHIDAVMSYRHNTSLRLLRMYDIRLKRNGLYTAVIPVVNHLKRPKLLNHGLKS